MVGKHIKRCSTSLFREKMIITMRYHFVPMIYCYTHKNKNYSTFAVGSVKWFRCHGNSLVTSQKLNTELPYDLQLEKTHTCMGMSTVTLFAIHSQHLYSRRKWKPIKCPYMDEWINKSRYTHEKCWVILHEDEWHADMMHAMMWKNLGKHYARWKKIQRVPHCTTPFTWNIQNREIQRVNGDWWLPQDGEERIQSNCLMVQNSLWGDKNISKQDRHGGSTIWMF